MPAGSGESYKLPNPFVDGRGRVAEGADLEFACTTLIENSFRTQTRTPAVATKLICTPWILCQVLQSSSFIFMVPDFSKRAGQRPELKKLSFHKGKSYKWN